MQLVSIAPVHLRAEVIHHGVGPAGRQPGVDVAVLGGKIVLRIPLRTDAEPQGRVCCLHGIVRSLDQARHVLLPPGCQILLTAGLELRRVEGGFGRGIKIIVEVDAVHGVALHKLGHPLHHIRSGLRDGRVQVDPLAHRAAPLRMGVHQIRLPNAGRHGRRAFQPVRVDPGFQRKPPRVCLGDEHIQRVKAGCLPLRTGAEMAPRKQAALVQRIPEGPHLRENGVQPQSGAVVHQRGDIRPERCLGRKVHPRPFQIAHPDRPPLTRGQGRVRRLIRLQHCGRVYFFYVPDRTVQKIRSGGTAQPRQEPSAADLFLPARCAPLRAHASSCILYRLSAAQPRAQASSTQSRFAQKLRLAMPP